MKTVYLILAIFGTILPLSQFFGFYNVHGLSVHSFFEQLFVNKVSSFFAWDVIISALVTVAFILSETKKKAVKYSAWCFLALFCAGVSSGLPLFLYLRERSR